MSLRDFNSNNDRIIALQNEPMGNGGGLDSFHTIHPEDVEPSNTPKIVGALAVALMVGVAGIGLYASSGKSSHPKPIVAASNLPAPPAAPAPVQQAAMTPEANIPASAPAETNSIPAPAPVRSASTARSPVASAASSDAGAASARMAVDSSQTTVQPQQQAAVIPEPVSPTPSPSDVATTNTQSGVAVPQGATTASDMPAAAPAVPPADQSGGTPAPGQPAAQSAGQVSQ